MEKRTLKQNNALHQGCTEVADLLIEHGISLTVALENLDVRPTMEIIKACYRSIATAKYNVKSTSELDTKQISQVWEDLVKPISEKTGVYIPFPSEEQTLEYLQSYDNKT